MAPYFFRKFLLRLVLAFPAPPGMNRFLRFYTRTKAGENFGDMTLNGELRFLKRHGPACRVVFDVGASTGTWTRHALAAAPGAEIHCFEPLPDAFRTLQAQGFPERVVCNPVGLSEAAGEAEIFTVAASLYDNRPPGVETDAPTERVRLTTLDAYCADRGIDRIDLLKIDAEGHDLAILRGGARLLREERIRRIQFEYGPFNIPARVLLRDVFAFFAPLPYTIYHILPRGLVEVPEYDLRLENFVYKNFAVLHRTVQP